MSEVAGRAVSDHATIMALMKQADIRFIAKTSLRAQCEKHLALFEAMKAIVDRFISNHPGIHDTLMCDACADTAAYKTVADDVLGVGRTR